MVYYHAPLHLLIPNWVFKIRAPKKKKMSLFYRSLKNCIDRIDRFPYVLPTFTPETFEKNAYPKTNYPTNTLSNIDAMFDYGISIIAVTLVGFLEAECSHEPSFVSAK